MLMVLVNYVMQMEKTHVQLVQKVEQLVLLLVVLKMLQTNLLVKLTQVEVHVYGIISMLLVVLPLIVLKQQLVLPVLVFIVI
jgi:hypothetical protein